MSKILSVLNQIAQATQDISRVILFEFKKYNTIEDKSTHLLIVMMWTLPTEIRYSYPSRNRFEQIMDGGYLDKFPMGLPTIRLSGTFGKNRRGILFSDGLMRLQFFKEQVIKRYHQVKAEDESLELNNLYTGKQPVLPLRENEVYVLTLYDFINGEIWNVDPVNFEIIESARTQANLPRYELRMQAVGKPEGEGKMDKILMWTMGVSQVAKKATSVAAGLSLGSEKIVVNVSKITGMLK